MPYRYLTETDQLQLDADLAQLLKIIIDHPTTRQPAVRYEVHRVITTVEGKLIRRAPAGAENACAHGKPIPPVWMDNWIKTKRVMTAAFENPENEEEAHVLHAVVTQLVRYHEGATSPYRKEAFAADLANTLMDYLSMRGYPLPPSCGSLLPPTPPSVESSHPANSKETLDNTTNLEKRDSASPAPSAARKRKGGQIT
jgi:hypothetical protein